MKRRAGFTVEVEFVGDEVKERRLDGRPAVYTLRFPEFAEVLEAALRHSSLGRKCRLWATRAKPLPAPVDERERALLERVLEAGIEPVGRILEALGRPRTGA